MARHREARSSKQAFAHVSSKSVHPELSSVKALVCASLLRYPGEYKFALGSRIGRASATTENSVCHALSARQFSDDVAVR
jgi:hypothetical protein